MTMRLTAVPYPFTQTVRANGLTNPSFETNLAGWTAAGAAVPTLTRQAGGVIGDWCARMVATVAAAPMILASATAVTTAGLAWTVSAYVRGQAGRTVRARLYWGPSAATVLGAPVVLTGEWQRVSVSAVAPAATTQVAAAVVVDAAGVAVGSWCDTDCVLLEQTPALGSYFDGSLPDRPFHRYDWTGTAHASSSTYTARVPAAGAVTVDLVADGGAPSVLTRSDEQAAEVTVHRLIGVEQPVVVITAPPSSLRSGSLEALSWTREHAEAVAALLRRPLVAASDDQWPALDMYLVATRIRVTGAGGRGRWLVTADFHEVPMGEVW